MQHHKARRLIACGVLALLASFGAAPALAGATKKCNADAPVRHCPGNDEFNSYGVHVLNSGVNACAAIRWMSGWPVQNASSDADDSSSEQLADVEHHADVVAPDGIPLPERGIHQASTEIEGCWVLKSIASKKDRPVKLPDARKPLEIFCTDNPQKLKSALPVLTGIGRVTIDPRSQQMNFFGVPLGLVPHPGSAYLGIAKALAVTLQKRTGAYTIVLPDGRTLAGHCEIPPDDR